MLPIGGYVVVRFHKFGQNSVDALIIHNLKLTKMITELIVWCKNMGLSPRYPFSYNSSFGVAINREVNKEGIMLKKYLTYDG